MNTIGIALVWCVVQVTLIGMSAAVLYLAVRRLRPAAAASVVLTGLTIVIVLSFMVVSPWPRWTIQHDSPLSLGDGPGVRAGQVDNISTSSNLNSEPVEEGVASFSNNEPVPTTNRPSAAALLWQTISERLTNPQPAIADNAWRWPATIAVLLLIVMAFGLGWLLLGVLAVRGERLRSLPVRDRELLELVDVLCAELACRRPIEVRQSNDLTTAATIGWRRPAVLLPTDWTTWSADQLRAVLAHEIAHVRGHDFPALLFGQIALVLHFYHPLLHWLMNRLRLEQELAADAAAASISGGQRKYLRTIAELALHQQDRPLPWPARTFLPTQTTFLRRIAMLRSSNLRFDRLSPVVRLTAVGAVLLCGLFVAGLRAPSGTSVVAAEAEDPIIPVQNATGKKVKLESDNILVNPGAENGDDYADDWLQGRPIEGVKYVWDKDVAFKGKASLCIRKTVNRYFPIAEWSQVVRRKGDQPFLEVSAQVKAKKAYKAILDVSFLDENDRPISHQWAAYIGAKKQGDPPADHNWKKYSGTVKIPESAAKLCISLQDYGPGTVWFDDVQARYANAPSDEAEAGNYWAKYRLWAAYHKGANGVAKNPEKAKRWLAKLVDGTYLATFRPVKGFNPKTPMEFITQFRKHSNLRSERKGVGGASFFRTRAENDVLIGSFITAYPDKMRKAVADNPALELISIDKLTPETFVRHEASHQESLDAGDESKPNKPGQPTAAASATELKYDDGKPDGKRSLGGSGEMIQFSQPNEKGYIKGIRIHGSRYGLPKPPNEDFVIYALSADMSDVLFTETAPYKLLRRGKERWVNVNFKKAREVPKTFWIVLDFKAHQTKGVYVSYDTSTGGKHSKIGLPGRNAKDVNFGGDWMIRVKLVIKRAPAVKRSLE